jgi:hypothetical protein
VLDYMERVLGYKPQTAKNRLRVARALGAMPVLTNALAEGKLRYSAVRELVRVALPTTEEAWCDAVLGKNLRQIEGLVRGHSPGDRPEDPADPDVRTHVVRFEVSAETFALLRQAHQVLDEERGSRLSDDELIAALCGAVLDRGEASEPTGRAKYQIAMTVCPQCKQGSQEGAGVQVAVDASTVERAYCDAQELGSIDGPAPERAHQEVPPSMMRFVWRRDSGHCRVPGCRSARNLEVHHVIHREHGGGHEAANLILLCSACHAAHHRGKLRISGTAAQLVVERLAHVGAQADGHANARAQDEKRPHEGAQAQAHAHVGHEDHAHTHAHVGHEDHAHTHAHVGQQDQAQAQAYVGQQDHAHAHAHVGAQAHLRTHVGARHLAAAPGIAPPAGAARWNAARACAQAKDALVGLGWKPKIAAAAVQAAAGALGESAALEALIFEALRRCPRHAS